MQQRREAWKRLKTETQDFIINYLKSNLNLKESEFENFLFPEFEKTLLDPRAMQGMEKAVTRILKAITKNERICVYGDYDCDGVPGTALLRDVFQKINYANVLYYIPHRHTEGYGLNKEAIQKFKDENIGLIITIDLGTTNIEEVDFANLLGIDVIITDHHLPIENEDGQILPKSYAIINNKQSFCNYANKDLCGSGTIFKLACALITHLREINSLKNFEDFSWKDFANRGIVIPQVGYEKWLLDLVAIATIADMVPLTYENRTLAIYGLFVLSKTSRPGLQTIFQNAKVNIKYVNETDIAFTLAPRINSASRMSHPKIALSMFSQNLTEGINAAHELEELNSNRKETTKNIMKKIYKTLDERIENSKDKTLPSVLVIGSGEWNAGVLGILASKILDKYNRTVFVWGGAEEKSVEEIDSGDQTKNQQIIYKGSCRSVGDIHLVKLMTAVKDQFDHFGGHELAGGFSVSFDKVHELENHLNQNIHHAKINSEIKDEEESKNILKINIENIDSEILDGLNLIGPFGVGNPKPIFQIQNIVETKIERFGKSKEHIKIILIGPKLKTSTPSIEAIKFFTDKSDEEKLVELLSDGKLLFEIEAGWMSKKPRLKIITPEMI